MKRKIYIVIDCDEQVYQQVYGSKTKLLESFYESECESYLEDINNIIGDLNEKCHNCENDIDTINDIDVSEGKFDVYNDFMACIDCDLFYCVNCVKTCVECNKKLLSREETGEKFKNKIKENFEKDGEKSLEKYYFNCSVREEEIEFSDDE
jgi:hypothetical protein